MCFFTMHLQVKNHRKNNPLQVSGDAESQVHRIIYTLHLQVGHLGQRSLMYFFHTSRLDILNQMDLCKSAALRTRRGLCKSAAPRTRRGLCKSAAPRTRREDSNCDDDGQYLINDTDKITTMAACMHWQSQNIEPRDADRIPLLKVVYSCQ